MFPGTFNPFFAGCGNRVSVSTKYSIIADVVHVSTYYYSTYNILCCFHMEKKSAINFYFSYRMKRPIKQWAYQIP